MATEASSRINGRARIPGHAVLGPLMLAVGVVLSGAAAAASPGRVAAPGFELPGLRDEAPASLEDFLGKVVYLDFWASWCGPCRESMPLYEAMYRDIGPAHFEILAINLDEEMQDAVEFLARHPVSYRVLSDPAGATAEEWGLKVMPTSFLLDRSGRVVKSYAGFNTSHMGEIRRDIDSLLEAR